MLSDAKAFRRELIIALRKHTCARRRQQRRQRRARAKGRTAA